MIAVEFPILARVTFRDHGGLTTRDKRAANAVGLITWKPVFDAELGELCVPVLSEHEDNEHPKRLLIAESNIFGITPATEAFAELDEKTDRKGL
jgi:hypothetical protein